METHYQTPTLVDAVLSVGFCQVEAVHERALRSRGFRLIYSSNNQVRLLQVLSRGDILLKQH
jgi:hypothetical protein